MTMLAELVDVVIGVDTHKHTHTAAVVDRGRPALRSTTHRDADPDGYAELVALADQHAGPRAWAIEGTGGYGAGLARHLPRAASWSSSSTARAARAPQRRQVRPHRRRARRPRRAGPRRASPSPAPAANGRRCSAASPPAAPRSTPPPTPNASCTPWSSPPPRPLRARFRGQSHQRP